MRTPPRNGTKRPGRVTTMTCMLTAIVECVADRMYQLTAVKLSPLPKSETNIATEKKRKPGWAQMTLQSTLLTLVVTAVAMAAKKYFRAWNRSEERKDGSEFPKISRRE